MKRDGRTLDHTTLETIRLLVIERVREGESPTTVIESYGFNRTTIYKWIKTAAQPGVGIKALRSTKATGRPRTLTAAQESQVFRWVNGRDPRQYGLDFGLWTRAVVVELVAQKFGVTLGVTAVGELLAKLGLTPQKPLQRAYQRDPEAIDRWQHEIFPSIAAQAKKQGGEVFFWDESGFRADTVQRQDLGRGWSDAGGTSTGAASIVQRSVGGNRQWSVLVLHLQGRTHHRLVCDVAAQTVARPTQASPSGTRWTAGAQERACSRLCGIDEGSLDAAFSTGLCHRSEPR